MMLIALKVAVYSICVICCLTFIRSAENITYGFIVALCVGFALAIALNINMQGFFGAFLILAIAFAAERYGMSGTMFGAKGFDRSFLTVMLQAFIFSAPIVLGTIVRGAFARFGA